MLKRPFVTTEDNSFGYRSTNWGRVAGAGLFGAGVIGASRMDISMDPTKLSYLHEPLRGRYVGKGKDARYFQPQDWSKMAGRAPGRVRGSDVMLNALKWSEEQLWGIPRTFDLYALGSTHLTGPTGKEGVRLALDPHYVKTFQPYLEKEIGKRVDAAGKEFFGLTTNELAYGLELKEYKTTGMFGQATTEVGLFAAKPEVTGAKEGPIMARARAMSRYWAPPGTDPITHHRSRLAATRQRIHGVRNVPAAHVSKGQAQQGVVHESPWLITGGKNRRQAWGRNLHAVATELSSRYFRLLDDPIEVIHDFMRGSQGTINDLLQRSKDSTSYQIYEKTLKNRFGVGGAGAMEGAGLGQLWGRHVKRAVPLVAGLYGAYYGVGMFTNALLNKTPGQLGHAAHASAHMMYARASEITGLTRLGEWQREKAPGSTSYMGLAAFPMSAYLTGSMLGSIYDRGVAKDWAWRSVRQKEHSLPGSLSRLVGGKKVTRGRQWGIMAAVGAAAMVMPFLPGALGSEKRVDQLRAEYSGQREVAIKKGRFWEMGRTPYEGTNTMYHRPNAYARSMIDAREHGIYGDNLANSPLSKLANLIADPYYLEKKHYHDRPYAITGPDDAGFGPLGTIYAATLGKIFKPPRLMHTDELAPGGYEGKGTFATPSTGGSDPSMALGGTGGPAPDSPYSLRSQAGELAYRIQEAIGLPGFMFGAVKKEFTGSADIFDERPLLQSAADITSVRREYWDLNLGGAGTASEAYRRFNPSKRFQIEEMNPLPNTMPSWMPGSGHYINFQTGDPYTKVPEGELRLPGPGFEHRYAELKGTDMEDYPLAYKFKILADVAPYSKEFRDVRSKIGGAIGRGSLTEEQEQMVGETLRQIREKEEGRQFTDREGQGIMGSLWGAMVRVGRANPMEQIIPFSPVHKFSGGTDVNTAYAGERVYSTDYPSWFRPIEHFISPAVHSAGRLFGINAIPGMEQERRDIQKHFDMLEYVKQRNLEGQFRQTGQGRAAAHSGRRAESTKFGADPYGKRSSVEKVLDKRDREYIRAMFDLSTPREQKKAMSLVDEQSKGILEAQYQKQLMAQIVSQRNITDGQKNLMDHIEFMRSTEGREATEENWDEYERAKADDQWAGNQFSDFLRMKEAQKHFSEKGLPGGDWVGWRPDVDLEDIKLKFVMEEGKDFHDFGLWETQVRDLARKPYIDDAVDEMRNAGSSDAEGQIFKMLSASGHVNIDVSSNPSPYDRASVSVDQDNTEEIERYMNRMGLL